MYGDTGEDGGFGDDEFGDMFNNLFTKNGASSFDEFDDFMSFLEKDNLKSFQSFFRGLGKNYRMGAQRGNLRTRAMKGAKKGKGGGKDEIDMMDDMMAMMMMGEMMSMGMNESELDKGFGFGVKMPKGKK